MKTTSLLLGCECVHARLPLQQPHCLDSVCYMGGMDLVSILWSTYNKVFASRLLKIPSLPGPFLRLYMKRTQKGKSLKYLRWVLILHPFWKVGFGMMAKFFLESEGTPQVISK